VGNITIGFGVALTILGLWGYYATNKVSVTALIPAFFGLAFVLLGRLAAQDHLRKHVMHAAAALALIGFIMPTIMVVLGLRRENPSTIALIENGLMAFLCLVFVGLCVKSFIDARRRREQGGQTQPGGSN
jgi:hypothetical protein